MKNSACKSCRLLHLYSFCRLRQKDKLFNIFFQLFFCYDEFYLVSRRFIWCMRFKSHSYIELLSGFDVEAGAAFEADTYECN